MLVPPIRGELQRTEENVVLPQKKQHETEEKTGNSVQKKKTLEVKKRVFSIVSCERNTEIPLREEKRNKRN